MPEVFRLAEAVTVLRDGRYYGTRPTRELTSAELVQIGTMGRLNAPAP